MDGRFQLALYGISAAVGLELGPPSSEALSRAESELFDLALDVFERALCYTGLDSCPERQIENVAKSFKFSLPLCQEGPPDWFIARFGRDLAGVYQPDKHRLTIARWLSKVDAVKVFWHELAHSMPFAVGSPALGFLVKSIGEEPAEDFEEAVAETCAAILCMLSYSHDVDWQWDHSAWYVFEALTRSWSLDLVWPALYECLSFEVTYRIRRAIVEGDHPACREVLENLPSRPLEREGNLFRFLSEWVLREGAR